LYFLSARLDLNVELASPADFVPPLPGWEERSVSLGRFGKIEVLHFDPYTQALSKIERGHTQDLRDVSEMFRSGLIEVATLRELFQGLEPGQILRYPRIDPESFSQRVSKVLANEEGRSG